ncbi:putative serine/threonine-protein kinase-like protein CCR3 isoform X1 [Ricinus communis]|uniref:putative serine/threonine-protein kinase-like protein CCR3 isoform X1 n=1 Tax=Ricinus communis TaxID=3988 RepID=UPI00201AE2DF|nr:putative serine/threonine-protein kinase-like protein CCR3 isoform X1 [Ricinus communis]XP_048231479.1 putative serine/threonine-protein kinase-like protein CCR3 isoform X1 [Ricinus communis]XP_048231480.1 putative serine/threonine-protein kinase-like protein CCR3 isoform X1 [Ricinus communis]XP_048231481.1 putative serine/threonine-protein kinase-like protein CCR3 isoform X1 [Ricinus communis]XP_048231482.1 putative serine/threonine-protein kinase-like protein CCR3 isoform X1 [Ricinus commu
MAESLNIDVEEDDYGSDKAHGRAVHFDRKVSNLERVFLIANFILELPSAVFDQLSSVHKPQYALLSMFMSFTILTISIMYLVYKAQKGVTWMKKGWIPWFYYQHQNSRPFGTFPDIIGLLCAFFQCIFASLSYALLSRQVNNPIKVSVWPIIFAFGLLYSRLSETPPQKRSTPHVRKLNRAVEFTLAELAAGTDDFSLQNKLGVGRSGVVYKGKLANGNEVVVKRGERGQERKFSEEEHRAFETELLFLSRLHNKHLVRLIGYFEDENERLLVYELIKNGGLFHHLHDKDNNEKNSSVINSWKTRIKIALDAARGIEYLHNYAVPPVIHRDIKSSNILLDANWTARIAEFALSLMVPESEHGYRLMKAVGTAGYIDPEYYALNILTEKSDVYSFGVVLLELLTGKKVIFYDDNSEGTPTSVVDFAMPRILSGDFVKVLDPRVNPPEFNEEEAVELVAYTALHCVNLEGRNRPTMTDVVANLERSLALCIDSSNEDEMNIKHQSE